MIDYLLLAIVLLAAFILSWAYVSSNKDVFTEMIRSFYEKKMKEYSHHIPRMYLFVIPLSTTLLVIGLLIIWAVVTPRLMGFEWDIYAVVALIMVIIGVALPFTYYTFQRVASRSAIIDEGDFGIVGKDENTIKGRNISITDIDKSRGIRQKSLCFWGKRNGQEKWWGADGGKSDGYRWGIYAWVRESVVVNIDKKNVYKPFLAFSTQRGFLGADWIGDRTTDEILTELAKDEIFLKTGEKSYLSLFHNQKMRIESIPWQIAEAIKSDKDYKWYSPIIGGYDESIIFGGTGSGLTSSDSIRLAQLEEETRKQTNALGIVHEDVAIISNIASASRRREQ